MAGDGTAEQALWTVVAATLAVVVGIVAVATYAAGQGNGGKSPSPTTSSSSSSPSPMDPASIIAAINAGQSISVPAGDYTLPADFSGFQLKQFGQEVTMDSQARFIYPLGYAGPIWYASDAAQNVAQVKISGGQFWEAGSYTQWHRKAKGILLDSTTSNGILENAFRDMWFSDCDMGIDFEFTGGTSFINNNEFQNITITHPQTYGIKGALASSLNSFLDITIEMADYSGPGCVGVLVDGADNDYYNVSPEDATGSQSTCHVAATATGCTRTGGTMTTLNYVNSAPAGANPGF